MAPAVATAAAPPSTNVKPDSLQRSKILLLGQRRSGKTSIHRVLFDNTAPNETFYLEPTTRIEKHIYDTVIPLEIWDCPGSTSPESLGTPFSEFAVIVFVIDISNPMYQQAIKQLVDFAIAAYEESPETPFEVFVHKVDVYSDDYKLENFKQITQRVNDELFDLQMEHIQLNFQATSCYDHTIYDAFSRVIQKLIEALPYIEDLLNVFCANAQASKAFLFDIRSRLYVATDASPVDAGTHSLCCDYIKMLTAFRPLYASAIATPARITPPSRSSSTLPSRAPSAPPPFSPSAALALAQGTTLTFHQATPALALLALLPSAVYEARRGLLEYNVVFLREGVQEIVNVEREARGGT
ncbi:Gtr1/RagA G protein conserved region-domain-containing protein [Vararia minispora EC-137]|uniref:Gtr1/RagA G protein conserved region-domain-containing protein n=1 Tax=Vararia minispora EC-137 TaxID=1314806 RepID=A0ACB8QPF6_9AGAM|nr:Gtr1/RagA G protein conserved region-domain-containing protein [Vararia minispora EC-137]